MKFKKNISYQFVLVMLAVLIGIRLASKKKNIPLKVRYLFSHGFASNEWEKYKYIKGCKIGVNCLHCTSEQVTSFSYPDVIMLGVPNFLKANIAQENDIACLKSEVEKIIQNNQEEELVIFGISRGASTALNYMALYDNAFVKALIVESPFDSMATIIDNKRKQFGFKFLSNDFCQRILENIFRQYKRDGIQPIDLVSKIRKNLPILIICSKKDSLVPCHSTINLYKKLKKSGHNKVYLLQVEKGIHGLIIYGKSRDVYQKGMHAFLAKCGFPHDPALALEGEQYLR
ncbi:MAG: prolyl oligopeptidase family serine peptidase [Candidatus Babeliales bacterium]